MPGQTVRDRFAVDYPCVEKLAAEALSTLTNRHAAACPTTTKPRRRRRPAPPLTGEDYELALAHTVEHGALLFPDGLSCVVEEAPSDTDGTDAIRLVLSSTPFGIEVSEGWQFLPEDSSSDVHKALEWATERLNDLLKRCDPRQPSTHEVVLDVLASVSSGDSVPGADLLQALTARLEISDEEIDSLACERYGARSER